MACPTLTETRTATRSCTTDPASGLEARPDNLSCVAPARGGGNSTISTPQAFASLPDFVEPVAMLQAPGDSSRWFVVEKPGIIRAFAKPPRQVFLHAGEGVP